MYETDTPPPGRMKNRVHQPEPEPLDASGLRPVAGRSSLPALSGFPVEPGGYRSRNDIGDTLPRIGRENRRRHSPPNEPKYHRAGPYSSPSPRIGGCGPRAYRSELPESWHALPHRSAPRTPDQQDGQQPGPQPWITPLQQSELHSSGIASHEKPDRRTRR